MTWIFIYAGIIALGILRVATSKTTLLLRGKTVLVFNFLFVILVFLVSLIGRSIPSATLFIFLAIILIPALFGKNTWILFRNAPARTAETIERCLSMILISFTKHDAGYSLNLSSGIAEMTVYGLSPGIVIMNFHGEWKQKKVEVLRALLRKNFGSMFPKIVIHLNNKNDVTSN